MAREKARDGTDVAELRRTEAIRPNRHRIGPGTLLQSPDTSPAVSIGLRANGGTPSSTISEGVRSDAVCARGKLEQATGTSFPLQRCRPTARSPAEDLGSASWRLHSHSHLSHEYSEVDLCRTYNANGSASLPAGPARARTSCWLHAVTANMAGGLGQPWGTLAQAYRVTRRPSRVTAVTEEATPRPATTSADMARISGAPRTRRLGPVLLIGTVRGAVVDACSWREYPDRSGWCPLGPLLPASPARAEPRPAPLSD